MLGTETVAIRQSGGVGPKGDPIAGRTWTVDNCLVAPASTAEQLAIDRTGGTTSVVVTLPITASIDHTCDLGIRGRWYRIIGDAEPFINDEDPELSGYQVTATRAQGA